MANDFAFIFYPGDYLRDTQCLSERVQVAYDRIMCEHMRNICITQAQLKFFTKKLTEDELSELLMVLTQVDGGYQIDWVVASITKRRAYNESRRQNRLKKDKKTSSTYVDTYVSHKENEFDNTQTVDIGNGSIEEGGVGETVEEEEVVVKVDEKLIAPRMVGVFKNAFPQYPIDLTADMNACLDIAYKIGSANGWKKSSVTNGKMESCISEWQSIVDFIKSDQWYRTKSIKFLNDKFQDLIQAKNNSNGTTHKQSASGNTVGRKSTGAARLADDLRNDIGADA